MKSILSRFSSLSILLLLALGAGPCSAQTPVTLPITGNLGQLAGTPQPNAYVTLLLENCSGGLPQITGYTNIVPTSAQFVADTNGQINGTVWANDQITCGGTTGATIYALSLYDPNNNQIGQTQCFQVVHTQGAWNINTQSTVACGTTPPNPTNGTFGNLNSTGFFQGNNGAFTGSLSVNSLTSTLPITAPNLIGNVRGSIVGGTVSAAVNNWQNPLTYGVGSNQSATTLAVTGTTGTGALTFSGPADFVAGNGVMILHGGPVCGAVKGSGCSTAPTPGVSPQGTTGATAYSYKLACIDGLGGIGIAGSAGSTSSGNATLAGVVSGTAPISGNFNKLTWTGIAGCYEVAVYRNNALIAEQYTGTSGTQTFNDIGFATWTSRDLPAAPPSVAVNDNYTGIIKTITGTTATIAPNLAATVTSATAYHDDAPLLQAAIAASPFVDVPQANYLLRYPINYTKVNSSFTNAGEIKGSGNWLCDTGDIGIDTTGSQNIKISGQFFGLGPTADCSIGIYVSRDTSTGDLAQDFTLENDGWQLGNIPAGVHLPQMGGRGPVGIYNHAGEVHHYYNLQFQTARWMVLTSFNIDHVSSLFSSTDDTSPQSMSQVECTGCYGSGNVFAELETAYSITFRGGYGLGGFLSLEHPWGFEMDSGQNGRFTVNAFRIEGKNGLISVAPGSILNEPYVMTDLYRVQSPPYAIATTPLIYLNSGATLTNASLIQVDDYGGSGANVAPVVDGISCAVTYSTLFVGIWQSTGTCNGGSLTGNGNVLIGHVAADNALQQAYVLGDFSAATWIKVGTWVNQNQSSGNTLKLTLLGGFGDASTEPSQGEGDILVRMGNQTAAPNLAGVSMVTYGSTGATPGSTVFDQLKVAATGGSTSQNNSSWDIYVHEAQTFAGGTYIVQKQSGDQWIPISNPTSDPGSASASLVVGSVNAAAIQGIPATFSDLSDVNAAAGSGTNCLQINTAGLISNTGSACGGGGGSGNATSIQGVAVDPTAPTAGQLLAYNGASWIPTTTGGSVSFGSVTAGTSGAHLVMGAGGSITVTAGGTVQATSLSGNIPESQVVGLTTDLAGKVATTTTVNGHALSGPVVVSASDLTTGTLPHAQLPALLSGDIPNNAAATTNTAGGLAGNPNIAVTNLTIAGTCTGCPGAGSLPNATDTLDKLVVNNVGTASLLTPANDVDNIVVNNGIDNTGVTPVGAAIATIINGLPANQSPEVYLPAGLYKINAGILVNCTSSTCNGIHIRGAGRDNTVLQTDCSGQSYGLWFNNTTNSGDNWLGPTVEDLTIQDTSGTGACSDLLKLTQIAEANISRVKLMSAKGHTYSTGTVAISGSTVTGTGTTFTSAMVPGVVQVAGVMAEACTFNSATSLTLCDTAWPTGTVGAGASYAIAYGGRGLTFDAGFSFTQYITVRDLFTYGDLFGVYSMGTNSGGNSRITFDGDASWNDGLRIPNSVAYFLGKHTDTFHIKTPANLVTRCWVLDSAHGNEISGDCEYNSTYTVMTTCNAGVQTQACNMGAEISADATSTGYGNAFTSPYVYLAGTAFKVDNANGATNLSIAALRGASFANTNSYNFSGTLGCPLQSSGVQATIRDFDCVYSPIAPVPVSYTITTNTTSVAAGTCTAQTGVTVTGVATTSTLTQPIPTTTVSGVSGWGSGGTLRIQLEPPTANTVNFDVCNDDPGAAHTAGGNVTWRGSWF